MVSVHLVADCFIRQAHDVGDPITNLKLQKLVYYAQAWHAALNGGEPLFGERIEAWVHGPVCPELYQRFRAHRWNPITDDVPKPDLPKEVCEHLDEILEVYGAFTGLELERLTHQEEPWRATRGDLLADEPCSREIPVSLMAEYYARQLQEGAHG
jgi:uncharacterized phage-associated protein